MARIRPGVERDLLVQELDGPTGLVAERTCRHRLAVFGGASGVA